ncbi:MAG: hypothetical protein KF861_04695 [Planctomycetaceae bacterium]|nr:hypothetical protein [Planctomycetaceae bacterium]
MLANLWLPILLASVAVFFASFLSWMIVQLHKRDWAPTSEEDRLMQLVREGHVPPGSYMFPYASSAEEMKGEAFQEKCKSGPNGILIVFPPGEGMGKKLGLTFAYFLVANFCIAYLATLALPAGADFMSVFRFTSTAAFLTHFAAIVPNRIWFHQRITGHLIDGLVFTAIIGAVYGAMWPDA